MGIESHYSSKKDRVFVRSITGHYKLKDELARLRAMPRVRKGSEIKFVDGPQAYSRHYVEPHDGLPCISTSRNTVRGVSLRSTAT